MSKLDQSKTPYIDAIRNYVNEDMAPFDVPGHHMGNIHNAATELFGQNIFRDDLNAPIGLDTLGNPRGVILESSKLLADHCHADESFFLINGTSSGIIAMIMTAVKANEKIIVPRNIHKSVVNALIISGAIPEYVMPEIDGEFGIANQPSLQQWKQAILRNPSAKAVFVINPTYFGSIANLKEIVEFAHAHNMSVLVDEAHGAHYYFYAPSSPMTAMDAGADMSAVSFHKTAGSLTQSSVLLLKGNRYSREEVQKSLNIINTTSPSGLLIASVDAARAYMASEEGRNKMEETYSLASYANEKINKIPGFAIKGRDHFLAHGSYDYDETKLVIGLDHINMDGYALYHLLKDDYNVQMELAETNEVMGVLAIGTTKKHIDQLIKALKDISKKHYSPKGKKPPHVYDSSFPYMIIRPRAAFHAPGKVLPLEEVEGEVSKEQIMMYPPGIPLIVPGEVWSKELVNKVSLFRSGKESGSQLVSSYKNGFEVIDTEKWKRYSVYKRRLDDYYENAMSTPLKDGFHMPFEGDEHKATLILMPFRQDTWRNHAKPAIKEYIDVIKVISEHEKVMVGIHPSVSKRIEPLFEGMSNVTTTKIRYNDAWARDNMPLFVTDGSRLRSVDFRFNAWGGDYDGLYSDYSDDDKLGQIVSKKLKILSYFLPNFVLEGGSIACDGEGTLIATEACLLSKGRNPTYGKEEIEEVLREYLGIDKVIWVPHGIYQDETNEHIDNMVAFVKPGEVVMAWCEDKNDPQYGYCQKTYKALAKAVDAKDRPLIIHKLPLPKPMYMTKSEASSLKISQNTTDIREAGRRLSASYVNFYQGKDFVVMPAFGVKEDKKAFEILSSLFPTKKIHQVYSYEILLGGGNIHCITMQLPKEGEK